MFSFSVSIRAALSALSRSRVCSDRSQAPGDQEAAPDGRVVGRSKGDAELGSGRRELFLPLRSYFLEFLAGCLKDGLQPAD